ncbi:TrkH family potassium uptake protein [Rhodohalobacter sp. 8-1]|uniref:TrkH family potassium uptake protein n=1 Tax=Rhodohalobacter sp. 8-1 TaxID=3131972 RepID=UPI0030EC0DA1
MRFKIPYHWQRKILGWFAQVKNFFRWVSKKFSHFQDDLYEFNRKANPWLHGISISLSVAVILSLLIPLFFEDASKYRSLNKSIDQALLIGFGVYFYIRLILTTDRSGFLLSRWPEGIAATLALLFGIDLMMTGGDYVINLLEALGISGAENTLLIIVQAYLIFVVGVKIIQAIPKIISSNTNPARLVLTSFLLVIFAGMLLLMLPAATTDGAGLGFVDALFMATSAVCVTGLIVVDTATHLTTFGQGVILVLIQLGGIGIITFATFLAMFLSGGVTLVGRNALREVISGEDVSTIAKTMKHIVLLTFTIEFIGFIGYYFSWTEAIPDQGERIWFSVFHSVSAFCNAGFSLYTNSLADPINATNLPVNITTMILIILGGIGFTTLWETLNRIKGKPYSKQYSIHSIIVYRMTAFLIIAGTVLVAALEWNSLLADYTVGDKLLFSVFQSVTARTAGFNTLDTSSLGAGVTLIIIVLMSIGASPSSTAGGLKTTTIYVLFKSVIANIIGADNIEISNRTVPTRVVFRALTSVFLATFVLISGLILLTISEDFPFLDILFEQVSAFMTVGLSRGITSSLSDTGKLILVFSMFAGRVGMLTVAVAFAKKVLTRNYKYPEESVMVA